MPILHLLLVLIVIGVLLWAITTYLPLDPGIKNLIRIVGIVVAVVYVLYAFGVIGGLSGMTVPRLSR